MQLFVEIIAEIAVVLIGIILQVILHPIATLFNQFVR